MSVLSGHRALYLALLIAAALLLPLAYSELGRDQANWLTVAMALQNGSVMYRDVAVVNTPGLGILFAAVNTVTNAPLLTPWIVHVIAVLGTIIGGYVLVDKTAGRPQAQGAAFLTALLWPQTMGWWEIAQKDGVAFALALSAMAALAAGRGRRWFDVVAGILLAAALLTKTSALIYGLPFAVLLALESGSVLAFVRRSLWIACGGIVLLLLPAIYLTQHDAWDAARASLIERAGAYGGFQRLSPAEVLRRIGGMIWTAFGQTVAAPLLLLIPPRADGRLPAGLLVLFTTAMLAVVLQGRGWPYHAVPALGAAALFLGACLGLAASTAPRLRSTLVTIVVATAAFASAATQGPRMLANVQGLTGKFSVELRDQLFPMGGKATPSESRQVADWIRSETTPDDRIFVWGMESQIYVLADRMFIGQSFADAPIWHPQLAESRPGYFNRQSAAFLKTIQATPPKVFVVARNDANPVEPMPSNESLKTLPDLARLIENDYRLEFSTPQLLVYRLTDR